MIRRFKELFKIAQGHLTLKHMRYYVGAVYLAQAVAAVRAFINARYLGPQDYGFWGWLVFIVSFGYYLHLGVQEMMLKEIPALRAKGQMAESQRLMQLGFSFYLVMLLAAGGLMIALTFFFPGPSLPVYRWGWAVAAGVMIFETLFYFEQMVGRAIGLFGKIGKTLFITNVVSLILTCLLVIPHGLVGIYVVAFLTPLFGFLYLHRYTQYPFRFVWAGKELKEKIHNGWPIVAMGSCFLAVSWVNRWIIMRYLGTVAHGYYTLGETLAFMLFLFPKGLADVLEPKLHFKNSLQTSQGAIDQNFLKPLLILAWLMPIVLLFGHVLLPVVLKLFLPEYLPGLMVMRILIWASYLGGLIAMTKSSLVALGRQKFTLLPIACAIFINAGVSLWMVQRGYGVSGVVVGNALALGIISLWLLLIVLSEFKQSPKIFLLYLLEIYLPFALLSFPCLTHAWLNGTSGGVPDVWIYGLGGGGLVIYVTIGFHLFWKRMDRWDMQKNTIRPNEVAL